VTIGFAIAHPKQQHICSKMKAVFIITLMTDSGRKKDGNRVKSRHSSRQKIVVEFRLTPIFITYTH